MLNLLDAEFYKWKKSKSFKVCSLLIVAIVIFTYIMIYVASNIQDGKIPNGTGGIIVSSDIEDENIIDVLKTIGILGMMSEILGSGLAGIFITVFVCIWCISEYINGAVKNTAGKGYTRTKVFLSKYLSTAWCTVFMNLICIAAAFVVGIIVIGTSSIDRKFLPDFLSYVGMQLLFGIAFGGVVVVICELVRNMAGGIAICMILVTVSTTFVNGVDMILQSMNMKFQLGDYWILNVIAKCPTQSMDINFVGHGIFVVVLWIAVSFLLGMVHFQRKDI